MSTQDATEPRQSTRNRGLIGLIVTAIALAILVLAAVIIPWGSIDWTAGTTDANGPSEPLTPPNAPPTSTPTPTAKECPAEFEQFVQFRKDSAKLINEDFKKDVLVAMEEDGEIGVKRVYLEYSGHDAATLSAYAHHRKLTKDPVPVAELVENGCLSEEGQELYDKLETITVWEETNFAIGDADPNGYNSGVDENGTYGVDKHPGVRGDDLDAIVITEADGSQSWVLLRCGNPVYPGKPNLPEVPTDNPPPTTPPTGTGGGCPNCDTDDSKEAEDDVVFPGGGWEPAPVTGEAAAPAPAPAVPFTPATPPHTDTGPSVPVTGATPAPAPQPSDPPVVSDPEVAPTPEDPGTEIVDPG